MQNLDSVAQEMSTLCSILRFDGNFVFQNLFRLSIQTSMQNLDLFISTSMQNLESVAQKMSKLWHLVQKRTDIYLSSIFKRLYSPNFISHILKVWTKEQK